MSTAEPRSSQLWHLDHADTTQVKIWMYCADVGAESGPLTILRASTLDKLASSIGYNLGEGYRVTDESVGQVRRRADASTSAAGSNRARPPVGCP